MKIEDEIKQPKFRDSYQKAAINILFTAGWIQNKNQEFFKPYGITPQQFNILRILRGQHPDNISGVEIKSRMLDKNSDMPRLLERLLRKKLIAKSPNAADKRAASITITKNGLDLLSQIDSKFNSTEKKIFSLTEEEAIQLSELLDKCRG